MRYGSPSRCPGKNCNKQTKFHRVAKRKCYECQWCGFQVYPTAGTIFHKSDTPLKDWFYVMYLMTATRSGVSAKQIERQLGVTYKTAWRMAKQVRVLMGDRDKEPLKGSVEVDETYFGGRLEGGKDNMHKGSTMVNKSVIIGAVERKGRLKAEVSPNAKARTIGIFLDKNVNPILSNINTDESNRYNKVARGYIRQMVNHGRKEYVRGLVHTNTIEGFWSQFKRSISGTHVSVSRRHLQKYVDEFVFRYNQRANTTPMFERLLRNLVPPS